jgi:hypothetical protein
MKKENSDIKPTLRRRKTLKRNPAQAVNEGPDRRQTRLTLVVWAVRLTRLCQ